jgi:hypothetical protein
VFATDNDSRYFRPFQGGGTPYYIDNTEIFCPPRKVVIGMRLARFMNRRISTLLCKDPGGVTGFVEVQNGVKNGSYVPGTL